jgi:LAO/AO transport system kinase
VGTPPGTKAPAGLGADAPAADAALVEAVLAQDRRALAKAITLLESTRDDHRARADAMLNALLPRSGQALRLGISGVPGVGKSTFIEALGLALIGDGHRVAVLAVDPSSSLSGGSILGDKTRMERLSVHESAYIRPSPSSGALGGVAEHTRETMLVCEAAGYDVVIVETVGVGQSEAAVAGMTDVFVLMQLPNAGDDLQAMKKGVMELADLVVINKADLDAQAAARAEGQVRGALRLLGAGALAEHAAEGPHGGPPAGAPAGAGRWHTAVLKVSALTGAGLDAFRETVSAVVRQRRASGEFAARRQRQAQSWLWEIVHGRLVADFRRHPAVRAALPQVLGEVEAGRVAPSAAARTLLGLFETTTKN